MRWQTQDPSGYEDGPHLYSYIHNNPLTHFDLFGLQDIDLGEGSFWQTYSAIDFDSFERQADYFSNMLITYAGAAQGFLETHIGMGIGSALNQALVGDTHLEGAQSFYSAGQSVGKIASYTTTLVGLAAQAVTSGMVFVGRIALSKAASYTIDKTKSIASERLNSQSSSNGLNGEIKYTKSNLRLGYEKHKSYKLDIHDGRLLRKEYRLPSGRKIDFLDIKNGVIYELKPFNPRAIKRG